MGEQQGDCEQQIQQSTSRLVHVGRVEDGTGHRHCVVPKEYGEHRLDLQHIDSAAQTRNMNLLEAALSRIGPPIGRLEFAGVVVLRIRQLLLLADHAALLVGLVAVLGLV